MSALAPSCECKKTGEGEKTILSWFTKKAKPNPFNPRVRYLFEHLDKDKISAVMSRKDITGEEISKLLKEEVNACAPPYPDFNNFLPSDVEEEEEEEEDMDEDEEDEGRDEVEVDGELQLGDQEEHGIVKRPQLSLVQSELECKKPRVAAGLGFQGEPVAAEM